MYNLPEKFRENVMVCTTRVLYRECPFEGFLPANGYNFIERITKNHQRQERILVEDDATYQQIIPYILCYNPELQKFLVYQRAKNIDEHTITESERFSGKWSIGIGGHIGEHIDHDYAQQEFLLKLAEEILTEEIGDIGILGMSVLGYINDNSHAVERVHFGVVIGCMFTRKDILFNTDRIQSVQLLNKEDLLTFLAHHNENVENRTKSLDTMIAHGEIFG